MTNDTLKKEILERIYSYPLVDLLQLKVLSLTDVTVEAKVIKFGKTMCPVTADLFDSERQHVAVAQVSYMLLK